MTRKDTIIFAVLINVGLLIVLFSTAIKSGDENISLAKATQTNYKQTEKNHIIETQVEGDEVDHLLNQLSSRSFYSTASNKDSDLKVKNIEPQSRDICVKNTSETASKVNNDEFVEVTVKRGDVLERIARANGVHVEEIMQINHMLDDNIRIGQVLKIPLKKLSNKNNVPEVKEIESSSDYYTLRSGDNPWLIALRHKMKLEDLLELNDLDEVKARHLKPGDRLRVR